MTRGTKSSKRTPMGRISEARESWVRVNAVELVRYEYNHDEVNEEDGDTYFEYPDLANQTISLRVPGRARPLRISLTALRLDELDAFETFMKRAFDLARPIVTEIDTRAQKDFEAGDDTHARLYRPVPDLVVRTREQREHSARLQRRPPRSSGDDRDGPGGAARSGDGGLADGGPEDLGAQDDAAEVHGGAVVGEVGGEA